MIDARISGALGGAICYETLTASLARVDFELRETGGDGALGVFASVTGAKLCDVADLAAGPMIHDLYHSAFTGAAA